MNNSTRNLKIKKLLIATTALVATAGMASADITITGHAAAGIYSNLDATAAVTAVKGAVKATEITAIGTAHATAITAATYTNFSAADTDITADELESLRADVTAAKATLVIEQEDYDSAAAAGQSLTDAAAALKAAKEALALTEAKVAAANGTAAAASSNSGDGVYSNAGVDFTMTGQLTMVSHSQQQ